MASATPPSGPRRTPPPLKRSEGIKDRLQGLGQQAKGLVDRSVGTKGNQAVTTDEPPDAIGPFARRFLREQGVEPDDFAWSIPLVSMELRTGKQLKSGVLAGTLSDALHLFRYSPKDGFRLASVSRACVTAQPTSAADVIRIELVVSESPVSRCVAQIDRDFLAKSTGAWFDFMRGPIAERMGVNADAPLAVGSLAISVPRTNSLGAHCLQTFDVAIVTANDSGIVTVPHLPMPDNSELSEWNEINGRLTGLFVDDGRPSVLDLRTDASMAAAFCAQAATHFPPDARSEQRTSDILDSIGEFTVPSPDVGHPETVVLQVTEDGVAVYGQPDSPRYTYAAAFDSTTVLTNGSGDLLSLAIPRDVGMSLVQRVRELDGLVPDDSGNLWGIGLCNNQPIRIAIGSDGFAFGSASVPTASTGDINVTKNEDGLCSVTLKYAKGRSQKDLSFLMQASGAFRLWEEWDVRRTSAGLSKADVADLYTQFNQAKKHNLLLVMFGDVILLNRALDAGISMDELVARMQDVGAAKFAEDDKLRDATVEKILLLTSTLTAIKQKFELLATMAPYYWAQEESRWLSGVFGAEAVTKCVAAERKRIVPLVRRQIRVAQSDMLRSLAQIEAAARPLEAIFARDEIQRHWSSKVRQFLPVAVQGTIGGLMMLGGGPAAAMGLRMVGGVIATHGLGSILAVFQKDREAAAQVRRAAETIFPWWQVFMRTLVVSMFEAAEFMDHENLQGMKRDKRLLDSTGEKRETYAARLQQLLRKRIVDERRNQFAEVIDGSGVRLAEVVGDIEKAIGPDMREGVNDFVHNLVVVGKKQPMREIKS